MNQIGTPLEKEQIASEKNRSSQVPMTYIIHVKMKIRNISTGEIIEIYETVTVCHKQEDTQKNASINRKDHINGHLKLCSRDDLITFLG